MGPQFSGSSLATDRKQAFLLAIEKSHGSRLRRYLSARLRNAAADLPDLMQEVFLRLLRMDDHAAIRNPQAYLFTIASHVLHQHLLRQSATPETVTLADALDQLPSLPDTDPAIQVEAEQCFETIGRGLKDRSPRAYATLLLTRCDGVSLQEVADRMGVSRHQAKKYLATALIYCQQELARQDQETRT